MKQSSQREFDKSNDCSDYISYLHAICILSFLWQSAHC